ncbi:MAG TPA: LacI family DNA-binding transcriptional regulator [Lachnospiraceae bacterium]
MVTIKDIAQRANVSGTTVSIILNGKAEERHISPATKEKVLALCNEMGYRPNLIARKLRSQEVAKPIIAFYWPLDQRTNILASFLSAVQMITSERKFDCEIVIRTYKNDYIKESIPPLLDGSYSGALIGALSHKDLIYLESLEIPTPIVLINRTSEKFSTVSINPNEIGLTIAQLFRKNGHMNVAALISKRAYMGYGQRTRSFIDACETVGITIDSKHIIRQENSISGGVLAARAYLQLEHAPKAIYCESDAQALGVVYELQKQGKNFPTDCELLTIGMMNPELTEFSTPPISCIELDNWQVVSKSVDILIDAIEKKNIEPKHIAVSPVLHLRKTFQ